MCIGKYVKTDGVVVVCPQTNVNVFVNNVCIITKANKNFSTWRNIQHKMSLEFRLQIFLSWGKKAFSNKFQSFPKFCFWDLFQIFSIFSDFQNVQDQKMSLFVFSDLFQTFSIFFYSACYAQCIKKLRLRTC